MGDVLYVCAGTYQQARQWAMDKVEQERDLKYVHGPLRGLHDIDVWMVGTYWENPFYVHAVPLLLPDIHLRYEHEWKPKPED